MGLLSFGTAYPFTESRQHNSHVKSEGVQQLLNVFKLHQNRSDNTLLWGDEIEYILLEFKNDKKLALLDLLHDNIWEILNDDVHHDNTGHNVHFHPEYGRFMLESTPDKPYNNYVGLYVEKNMSLRRLLANKKLSNWNTNDNKFVPMSITVFPIMGIHNFTNLKEEWIIKNSASRSMFVPDQVINKHIRFPTLTSNIRQRRGEKVAINIPMYQDLNTPEFDDSIDNLPKDRTPFPYEDSQSIHARLKNHIYMDAMAFGMGCSCLQLTYQAQDLKHARYLYDSLVNFTPIFLAVTAASAAFKGWVSENDVRWSVIAGAVDDRTPFERNKKPLIPEKCSPYGGIEKSKVSEVKHIPKSRYDSVDLFLGGNEFFSRKFNDTNVPVNDNVLKKLLDDGGAMLDYDLAKHFAHLYVRDPLVIFEEVVNQDNKHSTNHFENIQSTNWQTLRFKPPPLPEDDTINPSNLPGWRVEFRSMEVQLTDFENAAFATVIYLIVHTILNCNMTLNPYIPMSQIEYNMKTAHKRDSILNSKFYWKKNFNSLDSDESSSSNLLTIDEIFNSSKNGIFANFVNPALRSLSMIEKNWQELESASVDSEEYRIFMYLKLISLRASGKLPTAAHFTRSYILNHSDYKKDSRVSHKINYDLLRLFEKMSEGKDLEQFLGKDIGDYLSTHFNVL